MSGDSVVQGLSGALLIGLSGFLYLHASYYQRFRYALVGHQTRASLAFAYGLAFLVLAGVLSRAGFPGAAGQKALASVWVSITPVATLNGIFGAAPLLGLLIGVLSNFWRLIRASDKSHLKYKKHALFTDRLDKRLRLAAMSDVAESGEDHLLSTMWRAATQGKLIQVTMKSRKVYVGSPLLQDDPSVNSLWLKILPIASGFRDSETLAYIPTTDYRALFDSLASSARSSGPEINSMIQIVKGKTSISFDQNDLGFLLPWTEVVSITIHDPALEAFFSPPSDEGRLAGDSETETGAEIEIGADADQGQLLPPAFSKS